MRITGGKLRGSKFDFPKNKDTRPTSSLVRLSIFNSIGIGNIEGKLVLDMFAGSGSLGIEALSRNAKHVDFVEISKMNCITLKRNLHLLGIQNLANIYCQKAENFLIETKTKYDTILMDPPYKLTSLNETLNILSHSSILTKDSTVIIGHSKRQILKNNYKNLYRNKFKQYGDSNVSYLSFKKEVL